MLPRLSYWRRGWSGSIPGWALVLVVMAIGPARGYAAPPPEEITPVEPVKQKAASATKLARDKTPRVPQPGDPWTDPVTGMEFVWAPGGKYQMGCPDSEEGRYPGEGPVHEVQLDGFWLGRHEVTRGQFRKFVEATGYKTEAEKEGWSYGYKDGKWGKQQGLNWRQPGFSQDDRHPVVCVSLNDAQAMAAWMSLKGQGKFQLPTEAQWEYACRAGTTTARYWGDNPDEACKYGNVADETTKREFPALTVHNCHDGYVFTAPVGGFRANRWGLYDLSGNAWEWCEDVYDADAYSKHQRYNPVYMSTSGGAHGVIRGGGWNSYPTRVRCGHRNHVAPADRHSFLGFRLSRTP